MDAELRRSRSRRAALAPLLLVALLACAAACAGAAQARTHFAAATFSAHGSAEQVYATGLRAGRSVTLADRSGATVATHGADGQGGVLFRSVTPGRGYRVRQAGAQSKPLTVFSTRSAPPGTRGYQQKIPTDGYGYLTTRDGIKLAIDVHLPGSGATGPYPTLIEYAGYGYADPAGPQSGISAVANLLGFAVVDVNMRGTGCSGGAFDYFEALQGLDGYDVIETVARQPWVLGHRVGMMGISYGGISQLFVGETNPPHLAGITPLSVIDNSATTLYAGGLLNTGFALNWSMERDHDALPASATGGQPWALKKIEAGDQTCRSNQALHGEAANLVDKVRANAHYVPAVADPVSPVTFVHKIHAPTFLACQWTDEQTGGHCADLAQHFTGTGHKWFTFTNGTHIDSLDPQTFNRWYDFLELYVAHRAPHLTDAAKGFAPVVYTTAMGISGITLPPDPIQDNSSYAGALAAYQRLAPIRVMFDNGAGNATPGDPFPGFEHSFSRFPVPGTRARSWYLGSGGSLTATKSASGPPDRFTWSARSGTTTDFSGSDDGSKPGALWTTTPAYHWNQPAPGSSDAYVTAPLSADTVVIGAGAAHLWIKASKPSVDLQVTVTEVRPDGKETFVQSGWLRASERKLDAAKSTLLAPVLSLRAADVSPLPMGRFTEVTVPLYYEGHAYRRDSRIRITVSAPGGDQPVWSFSELSPQGRATVQIAHSAGFPSRLILPVVGGVAVPTGLPPCPGLRGEPCRSYVPGAGAQSRQPLRSRVVPARELIPRPTAATRTHPRSQSAARTGVAASQ